jgi:Pyruvate/2-oxoacid:ferredoxin oxidoreductase delta subunit
MISIPENLDARVICKRHHANIPARTCIARQELAAKTRSLSRFVAGYDPLCLECETGIFVSEALGIKIKRPVKKKEKTKKCRTCGKVLPLSKFNKQADIWHSLQGRCRDCQIKANKKRQIEKEVLGII